jgi:protein O-mannosyl-transferase
VGLLLTAVTLAVFWPVRLNDFVNYDDPVYVTENPHVQAGLTRAGISWAFGELHGEQTYWHPLTWVSHMVDCQVFGLKPAGHHLINLLFHTLNAVLVFLVFRRMTGAFWRCAVLAALFALHPLQVESVAWVTERKNVLSAFFWLLTMWAYVRYAEKSKVQSPESKVRSPKSNVQGSRFKVQGSRFPSRPSAFPLPSSIFYLLALFLFALGLMCKPVLVTLPFALLLLDYWPLRRLELASVDASGQGSRFKVQGSEVLRLLVEKLPFLVLAGASSAITIMAHRGLGLLASAEMLPWHARLANAVVSYVRYLGKTVWPAHLAVFYPYGRAWPIWIVVACGALLLALTLLALGTARTRPYLLVGWFWFLGVLVPFIGLIQGGAQAMADRFAYVPGLGLLLALVWGAHEWAARWRHRALVLSAAAGLASVLCFALVRQQVGYWQNSEALFRHALSVTTGNYVAHANLGKALADSGRFREAETEFAATLAICPDYYPTIYALGNVVWINGDSAAALKLFNRALQTRPHDATAHYNHGIALAALGQEAEAIQQYQEALQLDPKLAPAHNNLAGLLISHGKVEEGLAHALTALRLDPEFFQAHLNAGNALFLQDKFPEAEAHYRAGIKLKPNSAQAYLDLGKALVNQDKLQEAEIDLKEAARLRPRDAEAHQILAKIYTVEKRVKEALDEDAAASNRAPH